jgi:hypothetical protein
MEEIEIAEGRVLDAATTRLAPGGQPGTLRHRAQGGVVLAVATGVGVQVTLIDSSGEPVETRTILTHPIVRQCAKVRVREEGEDNLVVSLICDGAMPLPPEIRGSRAQIRDFNWRVRGTFQIDVTLDDQLLPIRARRTPTDLTSPPDRYELRRYIQTEMPRKSGARVRVFAAAAIAPNTFLALYCTGPDGEPAEVLATILSCRAPVQ